MARTTIFNRSLEAEVLIGIHSLAGGHVHNLSLNIKQETANPTDDNDGADNENFDLQSQLCNPVPSMDDNLLNPKHITVDNTQKQLESNLDSSRTKQTCTVVSEESIENNENHCNRLGTKSIGSLQSSNCTDHYPVRSSELTTCSSLNHAKQATHHPCKICDSNFEDLYYLKMYRAKFFSSGYYQCTICNSHFDNEVQFLLHKVIFHEKSVSASTCSNSEASKSSKYKASRKRSDLAKNKIKENNSMNDNTRKNRIITLERSFEQCVQCKDDMKSKPQSKRYSTTFHGTRLKDIRVSLVKLETMIDLLELNNPRNSKSSKTRIPERQQQSSFFCCICDQILTSQYLLASHYLARHIPYPSRRCCICFVEFKNRRDLCSHIFVHCQEHTVDIGNEENIQPSDTICDKISPSTTGTSYSCKTFDSSSSDSNNLILKVTPDDKDILNNPVTPTSLVFDPDAINGNDISMVKSTHSKSLKNVVAPRTKKLPLTFKCKICNYACRRSNHLDHHLLLAHAKRYNKEKYSRERSKSRVRIERYQRFEHLTKKLHSCPGVANKEFERLANNQKKSKLRDISRISYTTGGLEIPFLRIKHGTKKIYGCKWCKFKSFIVETLKCHIIRNHSRRDWRLSQTDYKCKTCKLKFHNLKSLKSHQKRHAANGNEMCKICGIRFAWKDLLLMHTRSAHNLTTAVRYKLRCDICNEGFHSKKYLRIHWTHFHDSKNLECTICSLTFDTLNKYKKHKLCHLENKDHLSAIRDDFYKEKCLLECHSTARRPEIVENYNYLCNICKCSFPDELLLQSHTSRCHTADEIFINQTISVEHDNNSVKHVHAYNKCNEDFQHRSLQSRSTGYSGNSSMEYETCCPLDQRTRTMPVVPDEVKKYKYRCYVCGGFVETKALLDAHLEHCKPGAVEYSSYICKQNSQSRSLVEAHMTYCCDHSSITKVDASRNLESSEATSFNCASMGRKSSSLVNIVDETQVNHVECGPLPVNVKSESEPDLEYRLQTGNAVHSNRPQLVDTEGVACLTNLSKSILMETTFLDVPRYPLSSINENASAITCEICNEHFTNFEGLLQHWDYCFDVDSLKCNICGTTFKSERSLSNHKMNDHANVNDADPMGNIPCINLETEQTAYNDGLQGTEISVTEDNNISTQPRTMPETSALSTTVPKQATVSVTLHAIEEEQSTSTGQQQPLEDEQPTVLPEGVSPTPKLTKKRKRRRRITALSKRARALQSVSRASAVSKIPVESNKNPQTPEQQVLVANDETLPNNSKVITSSDSKDGNSTVIEPIVPDSGEPYTLSYDFDIQVSDRVTNNTIVETTTYKILYDKVDSSTSGSIVEKESLDAFTNNLRIVPVSNDTTFVVPKDNNNTIAKTINCSVVHQSNYTSDGRPLPSVIVRPGDDTQVHQDKAMGSKKNESTESELSLVVDESENKDATTVSPKSVDLPLEDGATEQEVIIHHETTTMHEAINSCVHRLPVEENAEKSSEPLFESASKSDNRQVSQGPTVVPDEKTTSLSDIPEKKPTSKSFELSGQISVQNPRSHCTACGLSFSNNAALIKHLPQHKASSCPKCHLIFFFSDRFLQVNGTRNFCSECQVQLTLPKLGYTWVERYTLPASMACGICTDSFKTVNDLSEHFKTTHMTVSCAICDKVLPSRHLLLSHARTHAKHPIEQLLQCCLCCKYFPSKPHLIAHISNPGCGFVKKSETEDSGENNSQADAYDKTLFECN